MLSSLIARRLVIHQTRNGPNIKLVDVFKLVGVFMLVGTGLNLVCSLVVGGSNGGFLLLQFFSGVVSHPRDLQMLHYVVSVESSSLTHHRPDS